jgi:hypothetical protein
MDCLDLEVLTMRALIALAVTSVLASLAATTAVAETAPVQSMASAPAGQAADTSDANLRRERTDFVRAMGDMRFELGQAVNPNEIREITDRYQPKADAFADLIEARLAAGLPVSNRYRNPVQVREYPERTRRAVLRGRVVDRGHDPRASARLPG